MKVEQLLEKKEMIQMSLLRQLILAEEGVSVNSLFTQANLSKNAFENYLSELMAISIELNGAFKLVYHENWVQLTFISDFSLEGLLVYYLKKSVKYQLLMQYLRFKQRSTSQLIDVLMVSESTLFRKQKELNQLLKEFGVQIKNGKLDGEELQIRYLYYELLTYVQKFGQEKLLEESNDDFRFIRTLERVLENKFDDTQNEHVLIYIYIMRKRMGVTAPCHKRLRQQLPKFREDFLFKKIDNFMSLYLAHTSVELNQEESLLIYIFLTSFYLLSDERFYQYDLVRSQKLPTPKLDIFIREKILLHYRPKFPKIEMEKKLGYQIAQANSQLFWFSGKLESYERQHLFATLEASIGERLQVLLNSLLQTVLSELERSYSQANPLYDYTLSHYASILTMIDYAIAAPVAVGFAFDSTNFLSQPQESLWWRELKPLLNVQVATFQAERKFDLVIGNGQKPALPNETDYYQLSEFFSPMDLKHVKQRINVLRKKIT